MKIFADFLFSVSQANCVFIWGEQNILYILRHSEQTISKLRHWPADSRAESYVNRELGLGSTPVPN